ncbi:MAG: hypothetical protein EP330_27205 [Deltaproteobacteria bacterium]|nr:MAG: hypothetical protein EP330_27205 [Deltaproteobacteria bacterium]
MHVSVTWDLGRTIWGNIEVEGAKIPVERLKIRTHRAQMLVHYDACEAAREAGEALPDDRGALTEAQLRTLALLENQWNEVTAAAAAVYPEKVRNYQIWTSIVVSWTENSGHAYVTLRGYVRAPFETRWDEGGLEVTMVGLEVVETREQRFKPIKHDGVPKGPERLGPKATDRDRDAAARREDRRSKKITVEFPDDVPTARTAFLERYFAEPDTEAALAELSEVRLWAATQPIPMPEDWLDRDLVKLEALVRGSVLTVERDVLHRERDAERMRRWVAIGVPVDATARPEDNPRRTPLARHQRDPELFATLLDLGADPKHLFDDRGRLYRPLGEAQQAALDARK